MDFLELDKEINIQIITKCSLRCEFCARSWLSKEHLNTIEKTPTMSTETFIKVVDQCTEAGKSRFCLTPRMGDLFLDKNIMSKLEYLEDNPDVEYFFFATNLLEISQEQLKKLLEFKKLYLEISVYGYNKEIYKKVTGKNLYHKFLDKLIFLKFFMSCEKYPNVTFYIRWGKENVKGNLKPILLELNIINTCKVSYDEIDNFNFGGLIPEGSLDNEHVKYKKTGICPTAYTGCILPNGDYNLCYMNDVYNVLTIGNILETSFNELLCSEQRKVIINKMEIGTYEKICIDCNEKW